MELDTLILLSFLLTFDGLNGFPNNQQIEKSCENCTSTVVPHNSSEISTENTRSTTIKATTDSPTLLIVLEEDSSSDSSEEIVIGELIEEEGNITMSSSEEVIDPKKVKSVTVIE
ncbi:uncharacterized protein [Halyomorpha halys]|uniref:uncharacterized protein isoform X2 n=1 Tax=Halyomorpha halys TaxID=286706 RepID=UPI0034D1E1A3